MRAQPLLYSLFTHDCRATHISNSIIKFADDATIVGLITNNDKTAYREEVRALEEWCQKNVNKMKEPVMDFRKQLNLEAATLYTVEVGSLHTP